MINDIVITHEDFLRLKKIINDIDTIENLNLLSTLIKEIATRNIVKEEPKILLANKIELNITPVNNNSKPQEKQLTIQNLTNINGLKSFIEKYCEFDLDESIRCSHLMNVYNKIFNENLTARGTGFALKELVKTLPITKIIKADATYYKGIKFNRELIKSEFSIDIYELL